jgi:transcriptional regulator with XRE-family HTH domain
MSSTFVIWLQTELSRRSMSHTRLAELTGLSRPLVSNVLRGAIPASCEFVLAVAAALEVEPVSLLRLAGMVSDAPGAAAVDPAAEVADRLRELPPERFELVRLFVEFLATKKPG